MCILRLSDVRAYGRARTGKLVGHKAAVARFDIINDGDDHLRKLEGERDELIVRQGCVASLIIRRRRISSSY